MCSCDKCKAKRKNKKARAKVKAEQAAARKMALESGRQARRECAEAAIALKRFMRQVARSRCWQKQLEEE